MYDKYYLSNQQIDLIETWSLNKPLFIYGSPGIGKTSLAKEILKDTTLTIIDSSHIKKNENMYDFLLNIIQKRNITLMFQKKTNRGLILDNLDVFYKYDKKNFKSILKLLETYQYYGTKIIVIFDSKLLKNRSLQKINNVGLQISYSRHIFYKIVNNLLIQRNIKSTFNEIHSLLIQSNYNLNSIHNILDYEDKKSIGPLDNFDSNELLFEKIITHKMDCSEVLRYYIGEENIISLNLLENISDYITDLSLINMIYSNYVIADIFDIHSIIHHNIDFKNYSCLMSIYATHYYLKQMKDIQFKPFIYNKYISRSLIQSHSNKLNYTYTNQYKSVIYLYLFGFSKKVNQLFFQHRLKTIEKKELDYYIKSFNYFYESKIKMKEIFNS